MNEQTIEKIKMLKLPGFVQALQEQLASTHYQDLSFDERLAMLVERECLRRDNYRLSQRLRQAQLKMQASIDQIDFSISRGLVKSKFLELVHGSWLSSHLNVIIIGPTGIGKTFIASALADQFCKQGITVRYAKTSQLTTELSHARLNGSFLPAYSKLQKNKIIIFDEWLRESLAPSEAREILDIVDDRYNSASCVFVSQLPVSDWHSHFQDPTVADAVLDRIIHNSIRFDLKGESIRKLSGIKTLNVGPKL